MQDAHTGLNRTGFTWTARREQAALRLADDHLSDGAIAAEAGVRRSTLALWKAHPVFAARIEEHRALLRAAIIAQGVADRRNRVDALNQRWQAMRAVLTARAADPALADVPGGSTGLLLQRTKIVGLGAQAQVVYEYAVDTDLLRELRAHEEQAARELGQWTERQQSTAEVVIREYVGVNVEEV